MLNRAEEKYGSVQLSYRGEVSFNAPQVKVDSTLNTWFYGDALQDLLVIESWRKYRQSIISLQILWCQQTSWMQLNNMLTY